MGTPSTSTENRPQISHESEQWQAHPTQWPDQQELSSEPSVWGSQERDWYARQNIPGTFPGTTLQRARRPRNIPAFPRPPQPRFQQQPQQQPQPSPAASQSSQLFNESNVSELDISSYLQDKDDDI